MIVFFSLRSIKGMLEWRNMSDPLVEARTAADVAESAARSGNSERAKAAFERTKKALQKGKDLGLCRRNLQRLEVCVADARSALARC